jgi:hypothetical protein
VVIRSTASRRRRRGGARASVDHECARLTERRQARAASWEEGGANTANASSPERRATRTFPAGCHTRRVRIGHPLAESAERPFSTASLPVFARRGSRGAIHRSRSVARTPLRRRGRMRLAGVSPVLARSGSHVGNQQDTTGRKEPISPERVPDLSRPVGPEATGTTIVAALRAKSGLTGWGFKSPSGAENRWSARSRPRPLVFTPAAAGIPVESHRSSTSACMAAASVASK